MQQDLEIRQPEMPKRRSLMPSYHTEGSSSGSSENYVTVIPNPNSPSFMAAVANQGPPAHPNLVTPYKGQFVPTSNYNQFTSGQQGTSQSSSLAQYSSQSDPGLSLGSGLVSHSGISLQPSIYTSQSEITSYPQQQFSSQLTASSQQLPVNLPVPANVTTVRSPEQGLSNQGARPKEGQGVSICE